MASSSSTALRLPLVTRRFRAFFASVNRPLKQPTIFDPSQGRSFNLDQPPAPWIDLGWVDKLVRQSESKIDPVMVGVPATVKMQVLASLDATLSLRFLGWSKLTMALAAGAQHMNVLASPAGEGAIGSGSKALAAVGLLAGSSATELNLPSTASFGVGSILVADVDYSGQTGFVGSGISGAYVPSASDVNSDPDYIRRISFNVARVSSVTSTGVQLSQPLPAGSPATGMKVQQVVGFLDREGGSFLQEWSALFVAEGEQGDRLLIHYPRLQSASTPAESELQLASGLQVIGMQASFRALPTLDTNDGSQVLCYRTFLPSPNALV